MTRILVTGVSGFIGRAVAKRLAQDGIEVWGLDRHPKPVMDVKMIKKGDILDTELVDGIVGMVDGVIHLAGALGTSELLSEIKNAVEVNILGSINICEACRKHNKPLVQIATGNKDWLSVYPITKECAVRLGQVYAKDLGVKIAIVRAYNAYGPHQKWDHVRKFVPNAIRWSILGEPIRIYGSGEQVMDLIWVGDVAEVITRALLIDHGHWGSVFDAGTGIGINVNDAARMIWKAVTGGNDALLLHEPMRAGEPDGAVVVADTRSLKPLGRVAFLPLERGILKTVKWYLDHKDFLRIP